MYPNMYATTGGTTRYIDRFPKYRDAGFFRAVLGLNISSLGIGTYLGADDDTTDHAYTGALLAAGVGGINLFDCAINYRNQRSERSVGAALRQLQRDEIVVCTKAGFLTPGAVPSFLKPEHVAGGMHSMDPDFLADQIDRSRANLGVDTIDVFYLHNPETQLGFLSREEFDTGLRRAFGRLEQLVAEHKIRWYGAATWDGFRGGALSLPRLAALALAECGPEHHFRFIQLPFNLGMVEAFLGSSESLNPENAKPESVLQAASRLGIATIASATLSQTQALEHMPKSLVELLPGLTNAQRAIQFTRSTPGIASALVGMGRREHVLENLGVAPVPPATYEQYLRLYQ
ncbi:MAG: aldo/keto reductase [Candidatus Solibacter sp.]|nr:aldo/keto reductase [Candidatus Solibacter sp.]